MTNKTVEVTVGVPKGLRPIYKTNMNKWLSKEITFEKIDYAEFSDLMVMATIEFDKDNCIYVLVPEKIFNTDEEIEKKVKPI